MSYAAEGGRSGPILTGFPTDETVPTPPDGIIADAVWMGVGSNADFAGRDVRGKAVIIYSFFVPGGRSHSAQRSRRECLIPTPRPPRPARQ